MSAEEILHQNIDQLIKTLNTDFNNGLDKAEVQQRLKQYGYNEIPEKKTSVIKKFLQKFWNITAWMLEIIIVLSWILHRFFDLYIVTALLFLNALISFMEELLASNAVEGLKKKLFIHVKVLRDGVWLLIPAKELVPGDVISIKTGDFIPADIKIISSSLEVDQSALTGESLMIEKNINDYVYSGSIVTHGQAKGLVVLTGSKTYFGKTIELVQKAAPEPHVDLIITVITKWLLAIVTGIILIVILISLKQGIPFLEILPLMLVLLLGGIPVALPAMFTISMAIGSRNLSKKNVLVSRLNALEDAALLTTLCIDKTGTLTLNQLAIVEIVTFADTSSDDVLLYGALASQEASLDPIDLAFIEAAKQKKLSLASYTIKELIPFEPTTKRTDVLLEKDGKTLHVYKGSLNLMIQHFELSDAESNKLTNYADSFAKKGYRTIAIAKTINNIPTIVGLSALQDPPRPESKKVLAELRDLGISIKLLTGDALAITQEIARIVDLEGDAVNFSIYKNQNQVQIKEIVKKNNIFAEIFPEDKYKIVKILQIEGQIVGMMGDGVNDAPALKQAEVGIAVQDATDAAKKAASIVLTEAGLYHINYLIKMGRLIFRRVNTWIINKISRTVLKTGFIVIAFLITGEYVISSLEMLLLIFMTDFIKLSLATDNEEISKKPCSWNIAQVSRIAFILGIAMVIEALGLLYIGITYLQVDKHSLNTFCFEILFYFAIFSVFVVRERGHFWRTMPSKTLLSAIIIDIVGAFLITTLGLLEFTPIPIAYTFFIMSYAFVFSLVINDWIKYLIQEYLITKPYTEH